MRLTLISTALCITGLRAAATPGTDSNAKKRKGRPIDSGAAIGDIPQLDLDGEFGWKFARAPSSAGPPAAADPLPGSLFSSSSSSSSSFQGLPSLVVHSGTCETPFFSLLSTAPAAAVASTAATGSSTDPVSTTTLLASAAAAPVPSLSAPTAAPAGARATPFIRLPAVAAPAAADDWLVAGAEGSRPRSMAVSAVASTAVVPVAAAVPVSASVSVSAVIPSRTESLLESAERFSKEVAEVVGMFEGVPGRPLEFTTDELMGGVRAVVESGKFIVSKWMHSEINDSDTEFSSQMVAACGQLRDLRNLRVRGTVKILIRGMRIRGMGGSAWKFIACLITELSSAVATRSNFFFSKLTEPWGEADERTALCLEWNSLGDLAEEYREFVEEEGDVLWEPVRDSSEVMRTLYSDWNRAITRGDSLEDEYFSHGTINGQPVFKSYVEKFHDLARAGVSEESSLVDILMSQVNTDIELEMASHWILTVFSAWKHLKGKSALDLILSLLSRKFVKFIRYVHTGILAAQNDRFEQNLPIINIDALEETVWNNISEYIGKMTHDQKRFDFCYRLWEVRIPSKDVEFFLDVFKGPDALRLIRLDGDATGRRFRLMIREYGSAVERLWLEVPALRRDSSMFQINRMLDRLFSKASHETQPGKLPKNRRFPVATKLLLVNALLNYIQNLSGSTATAVLGTDAEVNGHLRLALDCLEAGIGIYEEPESPGCDDPADPPHDAFEVHGGEQDEDAEIDEGT